MIDAEILEGSFTFVAGAHGIDTGAIDLLVDRVSVMLVTQVPSPDAETIAGFAELAVGGYGRKVLEGKSVTIEGRRSVFRAANPAPWTLAPGGEVVGAVVFEQTTPLFFLEMRTRAFPGGLAESVDAAADVIVAQAEALAVGESQASAVDFADSVSESIAASEMGVAVSADEHLTLESLTVADVTDATAEWNLSVDDALTVAETTDAAIEGVPTVYDVSVSEAVSVAETADATVTAQPIIGGGGGIGRVPKRLGHHVTVTTPAAARTWVALSPSVLLGERVAVPEPAGRRWVTPAALMAVGDVRAEVAPAGRQWIALAPDVLTTPDPDEEWLLLALADGTL